MEQQWKEGLGNKQIPAPLPPQAQLPLFVLDGHTRKLSLLLLLPVCWFLRAEGVATLRPYLGCLPLISFILPHHLEGSPLT